MSQTPGEQSGQPATARAEELLDNLGQRLTHFFALAGFPIQQATARMREEAGDIWAQAQNIRQQRSGSRQ